MTKSDYNIILCNPPFYRFLDFPLIYNPLGIGYLAAILEKEGYPVELWNFDLPEQAKPRKNYLPPYSPNFGDDYYYQMKNPGHRIWKEVEKVINQSKPRIVGITSMTPQYEISLMMTEVIKSIDPTITIILGGVHASLMYRDILEEAETIDIVFRGEAEQGISKLVNTLYEGGDLQDVPGIAFKKNGEIIVNEECPAITNLDEIPFPRRDFKAVNTNLTTPPSISMFSSRGCPYKCTFCARLSLWGNRVRYRSAEDVVEELEELHRRYNYRQFVFEDDTFTLNNKRLQKICALMKEKGLNIEWRCQTRANHVTEEKLKLLKEHGCTDIFLGIESGNQEMLNSIRKQITVEQARHAGKLIKKQGITLCTFFMLGYPDETKETMEDTFNLMKELGSDFNVIYPLVPMPGSELFQELKEKGNIKTKSWFYYFFWNPNTFERNYLSAEEVYNKFLEMRSYSDKKRRKRRMLNFLKHPGQLVNYMRIYFRSPRAIWEYMRGTK